MSLSIPEGGIYGILGANGAGKSTFFRLCLDLLKPGGGSLALLGGDPADAATRRHIGAMIETPRYPPFLTATQLLVMLARASGVAAPDTHLALARVGLKDVAERRVHHFSVGMKQRLGIAAALVSRPRLLILDEPTSGMDPAGIQEMRALMRDLAERDGVTILLSSHLLDEVQRVCDRVAIFRRGRLVAEERVDKLVAGQEKLRITALSKEAFSMPWGRGHYPMAMAPWSPSAARRGLGCSAA